MTIKNRSSFLQHVAKQLGRERKVDKIDRPQWTVNPQYRVLRDATNDELVTILEKQCKEIHTDFLRTNQTNLGKTIEQTAKKYKAKSIVSASGERVEKFELDKTYERLASDGIEIHLWDEANGQENITIAEKADIGITFSDITLAESGTVTLFNDKYNGRSISLLPQNYIAIIPKSTIVPRMTQATEKIHQNNKSGQAVSSCVSFITGPSNSADIEMNLIVGVHGPVGATYILVEDL